MTNPNPTAEITLGKRAFVIRPLTIGQLMDIMPALTVAIRAGLASKESFEASMRVLVAALSRDFPEITEQELKDTEVSTYEEISKAVKAIFKLSGLKQYDDNGNEVDDDGKIITPAPKDAAPGEAKTEVATA